MLTVFGGERDDGVPLDETPCESLGDGVVIEHAGQQLDMVAEYRFAGEHDLEDRSFRPGSPKVGHETPGPVSRAPLRALRFRSREGGLLGGIGLILGSLLRRKSARTRRLFLRVVPTWRSRVV